MIIEIVQIPKDILRKIPLSLRHNKTVLDSDDLPIEIKNLIEFKESNPLIPDISYNTLDVTPTIDEYSDFKKLTDVKDVILEYAKNYFNIYQSSYPFDPEFGCKLKNYLQMKDTTASSVLIDNELKKISELFSSIFQNKIIIVRSSLYKNTDFNHSTEYNLSINIILPKTNEAITLNVA